MWKRSGNPKNELRAIHVGFDEKEHGCLILEGLDVRHVLAHGERCASLRTMFAGRPRSQGWLRGLG